MRTLLVLVLVGGACTGTTPNTPPPVGAGSQPVRRAPPPAEVAPTSKDGDAGPPPGVKAPGNLPVRTASEVRAAGEALQACLGTCDGEDLAEGDGVDADCRSACFREHSMEQVEVVPDAPLNPPALE